MKFLSVLLGLVSCSSTPQCAQTSPAPSEPILSFYDLKATTIDGEVFDFASLRGKRVLLVNTASECGFTPQYKELQELWESCDSSKFVILGFPSNDFGKQEPGTEKEVAAFCQKNYGVTFLMMSKVITKKGSDQHPVYQWLTSKEKNGVSNAVVRWNFHKFLINEKGQWVSSLLSVSSPTGRKIRSFAAGK